MEHEKIKSAAAKQGIGLALGAMAGGISRDPLIAARHRNPRLPKTAMQVGSAIGAAAAGGAGVTGSLAAGATVITAKTAAVYAATTAAATVVAPFVAGAAVVGAIGYGIHKLLKKF